MRMGAYPSRTLPLIPIYLIYVQNLPSEMRFGGCQLFMGPQTLLERENAASRPVNLCNTVPCQCTIIMKREPAPSPSSAQWALCLRTQMRLLGPGDQAVTLRL